MSRSTGVKLAIATAVGLLVFLPIFGNRSLAETTATSYVLAFPGPHGKHMLPIYWRIVSMLGASYWVGLFGAVFGLSFRIPLSRAAWLLRTRPRVTTGYAVAPTLLWSVILLFWSRQPYTDPVWSPPGLLTPYLLPIGLALAGHLYLAHRAVAAPGEVLEPAPPPAAEANAFAFDAVAVTPRTRGIVAGFAGVSVAMVVAMLGLSNARLFAPGILLAIGSYGAALVAGVAVFRRTSRIAIGLDGIRVGGTAKERFVAYRDIDEVRARYGNLDLLARGRLVLRLQLFGKDAHRRDALVARIREAIARAQRTDPAASFVANANVADLRRAAQGAASYREATPSRDELWDVFESPALAPAARRTAGAALAGGMTDRERARFRVAVDNVAEPETRALLGELLADDVSEDAARRR